MLDLRNSIPEVLVVVAVAEVPKNQASEVRAVQEDQRRHRMILG